DICYTTRHPGCFVNLDAHAVSRRVRKESVQTIIFQRHTSSPIDLRDADSGSDRLNGCCLAFTDGFVRSTFFRSWMTHITGASHVRTIASEYNTEVAHHESVSRNLGLSRSAVRQRRSGPRRDDGGE